MFTSLKYSNVRLPPNKNITGFSPMPSAEFTILNVSKFTFKFFIAKTLFGINEVIVRCVKLQVLYPKISKAVPAGVELVFFSAKNRKFISKSVTNS